MIGPGAGVERSRPPGLPNGGVDCRPAIGDAIVTAAQTNLIDNFNKILVIVKEKLMCHIDQHGNIHRKGPKPKFSDVEVIALNLTAECLMIDSENYLFKLLHNHKHFFGNLIDRSNYNRRKKNLF